MHFTDNTNCCPPSPPATPPNFLERTMGLSPKNSNAEERDAVETLLSISSGKCKDFDSFTFTVSSNGSGTPPSPPYQYEPVRPGDNNNINRCIAYPRESKLAKLLHEGNPDFENRQPQPVSYIEDRSNSVPVIMAPIKNHKGLPSVNLPESTFSSAPLQQQQQQTIRSPSPHKAPPPTSVPSSVITSVGNANCYLVPSDEQKSVPKKDQENSPTPNAVNPTTTPVITLPTVMPTVVGKNVSVGSTQLPLLYNIQGALYSMPSIVLVVNGCDLNGKSSTCKNTEKLCPIAPAPAQVAYENNSKTDQGSTNVKRKRNYACAFSNCNKSYLKSSHLKAHIRTHTGEKPFICDWKDCNRQFARSDELSRHKRTHTGEKNFHCPHCNRSFMRSDHRTKHIKTHTTGNNKSLKVVTGSSVTQTTTPTTNCQIFNPVEATKMAINFMPSFPATFSHHSSVSTSPTVSS